MNAPEWLTRRGSFLRARALWAALFALVALVVRAGAPSPPPRTPEGVAAMLGAAVGGEVRPDDFIWEERGGFLSDAFLGRWVLFLARRGADGEAADLYRARVRLTRSGQPMSLGAVRNLTQSPLGDDRDLVARGHHAAYVTTAAGAVQGITLLDLAGEGDARRARTLGERIAAALESWCETGSTRGIGRTEVTFGTPPDAAREELDGGLLVLALGKEAQPAALDLRDGSLNTGSRNAFAATAQRIPRRAKPLSEGLVTAVREVLGAPPAAALRSLFDTTAALGAKLRPVRRAPPVVRPPDAPAEPVAASQDWPPPRIAPVIQPPLEGEGIWAARADVPRSPDGAAPKAAPPAGEPPPAGALPAAAPYLVETAIRPDPKHPEALVRLVALDTRQLDLRLEPGIDEPLSLTGLHGLGRLPSGSGAGIAVAAFTAGPASRSRSEDGPAPTPLGFAAGSRLLARPLAEASTVAIARDGRVEMGSWPFGAEIVPEFPSFRQTPDALLGGSSPARVPLSGAGERRERSALGLLPSGQLVYAWGDDIDAATITAALRLAGSTYAVALASAPARVGFAYLAPPRPADDAAATKLAVRLLAPEMSIQPAEILQASPNDFFYAVLRSPAPPAPIAGGTWAPDAGTQPTPPWLPAIHSAVVVNLGAQVHVTTFAPGRLSFRVRSGGKEPATKAAALLPGALEDADLARALAAIGLASGKRRGARGLVIDGAVGYPLRGEDAGVLVLERGRPAIRRSSEVAPAPGLDLVELPLTADDGKLRPEGRDVGSMRSRAAACVLADGTFVVAHTTFDSDEANTSVLLDLGCARVVALDRGSHQAAFVHRAGTGTPPNARYEASTLFALDAPLRGRSNPLAPR